MSEAEREPAGGPDEGRLHEFLADMFLHDVGLASDRGETPRPLDETEFCRIALDLELVDEQALEAARAEQARRPGARLWEVLEARGAMDVGDVLAVLRFRSELVSLSNRTVGRYFVVERLGEGASSRVYRAIHQDLFKHVALKVLTQGPDLPRSQLERFRREAATAARLNHPNIVGVHDVGVDGEVHYIAMDLVEGETLRAWLERGAPLDERLAMLEGVARAVGYAHEKGVLHRDLKPHNVLVRADGQPVVVDFGLARGPGDATMTQEGAVLGTPLYMAPEQVRGEISALDARADVYSLGVMLYEAVHGEPPFPGRTPLEIYQRVQRGAPSFPIRPRSSPLAALDTICAKCLDLDPGFRYRNAGELAQDLARYRAGEDVAATRRGALSRAWRAVGRRRALAATLLLLVLVVTLGLGAGGALRAENRRLSYANDVKSAYNLLGARLEPVLLAAEQARYREPTPERRAAVLADAERVLATLPDDDTGVTDAWRAWVRWLVGETRDDRELAALSERHPDNPLPPLIRAWSHLRVYADAAQWPSNPEVSLHSSLAPASSLHPLETPKMRAALEAALVDLDRARSTRIWEQVPELRWVEDLCEGYERYAAGDVEQAIEELEAVGAYMDLALEPMLVLAFAYCRKGELEGAFRWTRRLLERRPDHVAAIRTLAACHKERGTDALRRGQDGTDDLEQARRLLERLGDDATLEGERLTLDMAIAFARARRGENARPLYEAALKAHDELLARTPDHYGTLASRSQCLMRLAETGQDPSPHLQRALVDAERALELRPDSHSVFEHYLGARLMQLKLESSRGDFRPQRLREVQALARRSVETWGEWPSNLYYQAGLTMLELTMVEAGVEGVGARDELYDTLIAQLDRALELDPAFLDVRLMRLWAGFFHDEPLPELVERSRRIRVSGGLVPANNWPARLAEKFVQRSSDVGLEPGTALACVEEALAVLDHGLRARPTDLELRLRRGKARVSFGLREPERAAEWSELAGEDFLEATALDPSRPAPWLWRAALRIAAAELSAGEGSDDRTDDAYGEALEHVESALERDPDSALGRLLRAKLRLESGDRGGAQEDAYDALDLGRTHGWRERELLELMNTSAWLVARTADRDELAYQRALRSSTLVASVQGSGAWLNTLGVLLYRTGDDERALAILERSEGLNAGSLGGPHPADVAFRALACRRLGRESEARGHYERLTGRMEQPQFANDAELVAILGEARAAFEGADGAPEED